MTDTAQRPSTPESRVRDSKPGPRTRRAPEDLPAVITNRALDGKTKQLTAIGAAHLTQCLCCIDGHIDLARRAGATPDEITETIWVASEIRARGTFPHPVPGSHSHPNSTLSEPRRLGPLT